MSTSSDNIREFKKTTIAKLVESDELITAMGNKDVEENDEAIYKYIFPYFYIPYTIESAKSYICMKVNMTGASSKNDLFGHFSVIVWVISHQDIMRMDGVDGSTRVDYMSSIVEKLLNGSDAFGTQKLQLVTNTEDSLDMKHRCRVLTFKTMDISSPLGCANAI